jgi:hypothetical protein
LEEGAALALALLVREEEKEEGARYTPLWVGALRAVLLVEVPS